MNISNMIPKIITKYAKPWIDLGGKLQLVNKVNGFDVYICTFNDNSTIGIPDAYLWDGENVKVVTGEDVFNYLPLA